MWADNQNSVSQNWGTFDIIRKKNELEKVILNQEKSPLSSAKSALSQKNQRCSEITDFQVMYRSELELKQRWTSLTSQPGFGLSLRIFKHQCFDRI